MAEFPRRLLSGVILLLLPLMVAPVRAQTGAAQVGAAQVGIVPLKPMRERDPELWVPGRPSASGCIDVARIGAAVVVDPRTVDVVMRGGERWRLTLAQQCPQLSYYGGFYYQPTQAGKFCAGRDRVMGRAGGPCRVQSIARLRKVPPPR